MDKRNTISETAHRRKKGTFDLSDIASSLEEEANDIITDLNNRRTKQSIANETKKWIERNRPHFRPNNNKYRSVTKVSKSLPG